MGKSISRQRDLENRFIAERDNLFKEFSYAKKEIQVNFNHQKMELEDAFHQEIVKLYQIHNKQIKTMKLQMRDSQLGDLQEKLKAGKLSRHLSWPIAQSTPKQSLESNISSCTTCGQPQQRIESGSKDMAKTSEEWKVLVRHLKFALNNQKSLFENSLLDEKLKMQSQLEKEREIMEEKIYRRLNNSLQNALKERDNLVKESNCLQSVSKNLLKDMVKSNRKGRNDRVMDSDSDDEENSGDSGVEEKCQKTDKIGNYWRMKYYENQRKHMKKIKEDEERYKEKEQKIIEKYEKNQVEFEEKRVTELNELEIKATKELQKLLMEERLIHKDAIKDLNDKLIEISSENDNLKDKLDEMDLLLGRDVKELHQEMVEKLSLLQDIVAQE